MLKSLQVKNYVLIDSLEISFPTGLVIITGQTGAGKSILLGAISLVLGAKADVSMVGRSSDTCAVEACFSLEDESLRQDLEKESLDWNGGELVIRRVLHKSGRSRAFVNDEPVALSFLSSLSSRLVDIHSQHQTLMLANKQFLLSMLDHYSDNGELLVQCRQAFDTLRSHERELSRLKTQLDEITSQKEYNEAQLSLLTQANLSDEEELDELEAEQRKLANAEDIKNNLLQTENLFSPEDEELPGLDRALKDSVRLLDKVAVYLPFASELSGRLESSRLELEDILSEVISLEQGVDVSPERLDFVENRMGELNDLMRRFSCRDIASLIAERERLSTLVFSSEFLQERYTGLLKLVEEDRKTLDKAAQNLHDSREAHAPFFSTEVRDSVRSLELERAEFEVRLSEAEISASGKDSVSFMFSASGVNLSDVSKCASGGEMSRIMLCLKDMMARYAEMPTMIFDEIDTGVSGSVADKMGSMICRMGIDMQVFAITHLPQVAAKGNAHFVVSKSISDEGAVSVSIKEIKGENRVMELARMLSGSTLTKEAVANARALLLH